MEITKQHLLLFIENKCSAEEARLIADHIAKNPGVLDDLLHEQEWEQFETNDRVPAVIDRAMFAIIQQRKRSGIVRVLTNKTLRIAAAIILCVATGLLYWQMNAGKPELAKTISEVPVVPPPQTITLSNTSDKLVRYVLEDSSVILLGKNSQLTFRKPFEADKRDLHLEGTAYFTVAKDKHRPFTVYANGFSTTALGTAFHIKAYKTDKTARIQLFEGKVVVKNLHQPKNAIYLAPGEQCDFNYAAVSLAKVTAKEPVAIKTLPSKPINLMPAGSIEETEDQLIFKNTGLAEVMGKLSDVYKINITYDTLAIRNKKFIGNIDRKRTIADILNTIALLNDLQVTQQEGAYVLTGQ